MSNDESIEDIRKRLGPDLAILAHHYQGSNVVEHADRVGDSLELAKIGASLDAKNIVVCGVTFMAETASILRKPDQSVFIPEKRAGCVMADMADPALFEDILLEMLRRSGPPHHSPGVREHLRRDKSPGGRARRLPVHLGQCPQNDGMGPGPGRRGVVPAGPEPGPQHGRHPGASGGGAARPQCEAQRLLRGLRSLRQGQAYCLARLLPRARPFRRAPGLGHARGIPRGPRGGPPPSAHPRWWPRPTPWAPLPSSSSMWPRRSRGQPSPSARKSIWCAA